MTATSGFLAALECTKFVFGRGSAPNPTGGPYSALSDLLAGLKCDPTFKGKGSGVDTPPTQIPWFAPKPATALVPYNY